MINAHKIYASFDDCIKTEIISYHGSSKYALFGIFKIKADYGSCIIEQYIADSDDVNELRVWADLHGLDVKKEAIL